MPTTSRLQSIALAHSPFIHCCPIWFKWIKNDPLLTRTSNGWFFSSRSRKKLPLWISKTRFCMYPVQKICFATYCLSRKIYHRYGSPKRDFACTQFRKLDLLPIADLVKYHRYGSPKPDFACTQFNKFAFLPTVYETLELVFSQSHLAT